jgi:hypothetical protein
MSPIVSINTLHIPLVEVHKSVVLIPSTFRWSRFISVGYCEAEFLGGCRGLGFGGVLRGGR